MTSPEEEFFSGHPDASQVFDTVRAAAERLGPVEVRVTRSQVAFRRRRSFAYLWLPGRWLWRPSPRTWIHHLEVHDVSEIDDEVVGWLADAYRGAG